MVVREGAAGPNLAAGDGVQLQGEVREVRVRSRYGRRHTMNESLVATMEEKT